MNINVQFKKSQKRRLPWVSSPDLRQQGKLDHSLATKTYKQIMSTKLINKRTELRVVKPHNTFNTPNNLKKVIAYNIWFALAETQILKERKSDFSIELSTQEFCM